MAMKEITLQPNDHRAIRSVADELRIFEGNIILFIVNCLNNAVF